MSPGRLPFDADLAVDGGAVEAIQAGLDELARREAARRAEAATSTEQGSGCLGEADTVDADGGVSPPGGEEAKPHTNGSGPVAIFRSLFAGREDAYGTPDPSNPKKGLCVRERLTDEVIERHLRGKIRVGVYLLRDDLAVSFGAADFDGGEADLERALAFCVAAEAAGLHPYLERSRGKGFHVWLFFSRPVPAAIVRRALRQLADYLGLPRSLEIFPKQDTLDGKEFGNYIYLPLNGREQVNEGRTAFLDWEDGCQPFADAISPLREVRYSEPEALERLAGPGKEAPGEDQEPRREEAGNEAGSDPEGEPPPFPGDLRHLRPLFEAIRTKGVDGGRGGLRHGAALLIGYYLHAEGWPLPVAKAMACAINTRFRPPLEDADLDHQIEDGFRGWRVSREVLAGLKESLGCDRPGVKSAQVEYLDLATIAVSGIPPVPWILEGWLAEREVAMIAGGAGSGKTTTIADMAVSLASGRSWCGITPTRPCRVLCFDEEQDERTTARLFLRLGAPAENLRVASGQGIRIDTPEGVARLEREIVAHQPDVVILDSVQQVFGAISEKDNTLIGLAYREIFRLRDSYGVTFILIHHKRKSSADQVVEAIELVRGGTAHGTQCSTVWSASGDGTTHMDLVQAKRRGARKQSLRIAYHEDGPDGPITLTGEGPVENKDTLLARVSEWVVELLADKTEMKRAAIVEAGKFANHTEDSIDEALKHLVGIGRVVKPKRGWYALKESAQ